MHGDKLKPCYGDTAASWLVDQPGQVQFGDQPAGADESSPTDADRVGDASTGATAARVVHPVLVSQFDGVVRFKMKLRKTWMGAVHVGFARGDFRVVSRTIVFDQWSSVRVSAVLSGCQVSVFSGRIVRVMEIIPAPRRLVVRLQGVGHTERTARSQRGRVVTGAQPASDLVKSESPPVEESSSVPCQWASWIKIDRLLQIVCSRRFNQSSICEPVVKCRDDRSPYIEKTSQLRSPYGVRLLVASGTTSWNCVYTPIGGAVSRQHGRPVPWSPATVMSAPCLAPRRPRCNFVIIRGEQVEKFKFGRQRRRGGGRWSCESSPASATSSGSSSTTRLRR